jgi:SAM-dependent methyltransferase
MPSMDEGAHNCPLCFAEMHLRYAGHPGYALGLAYDIYECGGCGSSFAPDAPPQDWLYTKIYEQAAQITGYERYERFARAVEASRDPLRTLAACEDVYFAVDAILRELRLQAQARVLEIGCGLGYLVYSLARSGYSAEGWDVSSTAVAAATRRFGPLFSVRDANQLEDRLAPAFDVVIFTQFIEHVQDPVDFVRAAKTLLAPDGVMIVTTDNKSFFDPAPVWNTDLPPVHQSWLTERGIEAIAKRNGLKASFFDFTDYNAERPWEKYGPLPLDRPTYKPLLDEAGAPIGTVPKPERWSPFPLTRSLYPAISNAVRRLTRPLRAHHPLLGEPRGRRVALAALLSTLRQE